MQADGQDSLNYMRAQLKRDRIRDTARRMLTRCIRGETIVFELNKQAAYAGHISFATNPNESPLGSIIVTISTSDAPALIDWLAPSTQTR